MPFLACGDLSAFDSDRTYPTSGESLPPVAPPTNPPYKTVLKLKREGTTADNTGSPGKAAQTSAL